MNLQRNQFTVITGVSGSGKSTLAFDILFAEGQRRYLESLNAYARQFVQHAIDVGARDDLAVRVRRGATPDRGLQAVEHHGYLDLGSD